MYQVCFHSQSNMSMSHLLHLCTRHHTYKSKIYLLWTDLFNQVKAYYLLPLTTNTQVRYILPQRHKHTLDNGMLLRFSENFMSAMVEVSLIGTLFNEVGQSHISMRQSTVVVCAQSYLHLMVETKTVVILIHYNIVRA